MLRRDTILVVDDSPETLGFLTDMLDHAGYTVLIATDATGALELVDRITPDLILLDAVMPGMDGFEACRQLKRNKLLGHLPVIFMTGLAETERVVEGLAAGGVDYVVKPIVVEELLARIRVHLANARAANGSRAALDASGRYLLATDRAGQLRWCTPRARQLLLEAYPGRSETEQSLPVDLVEQLLRLHGNAGRAPAPATIAVGSRRLEFTFLSATGPDELLFCLTESSSAPGEVETLQQALRLTAREAEVLFWISRGKSNRDIGEILRISPRTVNKHLERVFEKLGVENRAAAAAQAVRLLSTSQTANQPSNQSSNAKADYANASMPSWTMKSTTVSRP
jgi:DNA-binding response OmpR family regulator/DNA-binding CsgD family transcriptional regulator